MSTLTINNADPRILSLGIRKTTVDPGGSPSYAVTSNNQYDSFSVKATQLVTRINPPSGAVRHDVWIDGVQNMTPYANDGSGDYVLFTGETDDWHTVEIRNHDDFFIDRANLYVATGSAPDFRLPDGVTGAVDLFDAPNYISIDPGFYEVPEGSNPNSPFLYSQSETNSIRWSAACDEMHFWTVEGGEKYALHVDEDPTAYAIYTAGSSNGLVPLVITTPDADPHLYRLIPIRANQVVAIGLVCIGGTGFDTTPLEPLDSMATYGDSNVHGNLAADNRATIPYILATKYNVAVASNGVNGRTMSLSYADAVAFYATLADRPPRLAGEWWGTGDVGADSTNDAANEGHYETIGDGVLAALPDAVVRFYGVPYRSSRTNAQVDSFNLNVKQAAVTAIGADYTTNYADGLHLNDAGNVVLANGLEALFAPSDTTPPTVVFATINAAGTILTVGFDEPTAGVDPAEYATSPSRLQGTLHMGSTDTDWRMNISQVYAGESYTLAYAGSGTRDLEGNLLAAFSGFPITNNSTQSDPAHPPSSDALGNYGLALGLARSYPILGVR